MMKYVFYFVASLCAFSAAAAKEKNQVYIKVGKANVQKSILALPQPRFFGSESVSKDFRKVGTELYKTMRNDLRTSSYFRMVRREAYVENTSKAGLTPKTQDKKNGFLFDDWKSVGAEFLIKTGYSFNGNVVTLSAYLYHVPTARLVFGKEYSNTKKFIRKMAHRFSNDVLEALTGKRGMFESRIVVSSDRGGGKNKEIFIMDWDGRNVKKVSNHNSIAISPTWSPDNKRIAYTALTMSPKLKTKNWNLYLYEIETGIRRIISQYKGNNSGAAFIPGTRELLLTIARFGNPDLYRIDESGKVLDRLTYGPKKSMNVEAALSSDGKMVAFSSDRSGLPMIYTFPLQRKKGKRKAKRIIFAGHYNSTPAWSPDNSKIAFAGFDSPWAKTRSEKNKKKRFDIFIMNPDGHDLERLTTAKKTTGRLANNEDPTFSPDGRHVMFISDRSGTKQIYIVNTDGRNERRITFDRFNYFKPKWSTNIE